MRDILGCGHRSTVANRRLTVNPLACAVEMPRIGNSRLRGAAFTTAVTVRGPLPGNCEVVCSLLSPSRSITGSTT